LRDFLIEIADIDDQIGLARDALRALVEQVAGASTAESDELVAQGIANQEERLELLIKQRSDILERAIRQPKRRLGQPL
jgi:hypothetical protein